MHQECGSLPVEADDSCTAENVILLRGITDLLAICCCARHTDHTKCQSVH